MTKENHTSKWMLEDACLINDELMRTYILTLITQYEISAFKVQTVATCTPHFLFFIHSNLDSYASFYIFQYISPCIGFSRRYWFIPKLNVLSWEINFLGKKSLRHSSIQISNEIMDYKKEDITIVIIMIKSPKVMFGFGQTTET